jgi:hypothetical protein
LFDAAALRGKAAPVHLPPGSGHGKDVAENGALSDDQEACTTSLLFQSTTPPAEQQQEALLQRVHEAI